MPETPRRLTSRGASPIQEDTVTLSQLLFACAGIVALAETVRTRSLVAAAVGLLALAHLA